VSCDWRGKSISTSDRNTTRQWEDLSSSSITDAFLSFSTRRLSDWLEALAQGFSAADKHVNDDNATRAAKVLNVLDTKVHPACGKDLNQTIAAAHRIIARVPAAADRGSEVGS
jgi:hypothetical protein